MKLRTKFGALLGAGGLILLAASTVVATAPTYIIDVTKTANPPTVPLGGASVTYTVWVDNAGTGNLQTVVVDDGMAGCTLGAPTGDDGDGNLEDTETWAYTCVVANVLPDTTNTATVNACHNASASCNQSAHDATDWDDVTVTEGAAPSVLPSVVPSVAPSVVPSVVPSAPASVNPSAAPTIDVGGATDAASEPATDEAFSGPSGSGPANTILLVLALGMLLASLILITPAKPIRQR